MSALVSMQGVHKRFPGVHALNDVSFDLRAGEVHALMGENGAGKSTLMKILAGVGIIHQELSLMNDLTAAQNIFIGREPRRSFGRLDEAKLNRQAAEIFEKMNLQLDTRTPIHQLTIAKQQMVEIAKALSYRSQILVMDEPTAALNDSEIADLFHIIRQLRDEGVGIIYISHKMDELKQIADRVTVMRDGETVGTVDAKSTPVTDIISMMVGRTLGDGVLELPDLADAPTALEVIGLNRGRDIQDVSFSVAKGEILGFAGLMGSGRTEVARAIFGADPLHSGTIKVHGKVVNIKSPADAVESGIGYLSEDRKHFGLATGMSVRANIAMTNLEKFTSKIGSLDESAMQAVANQYIEQLGIRTPSDKQTVRLLSGGNQQKVVIAKWLLRDSDILIFDEPTRGIDVGAKAEIYNLLLELANQGRAIIVISSELPEVLRVSHRVAVMNEGRLSGCLDRSDATQESIMDLATKTFQDAPNISRSMR